jgi:hypothetical protein
MSLLRINETSLEREAELPCNERKLLLKEKQNSPEMSDIHS